MTMASVFTFPAPKNVDFKPVLKTKMLRIDLLSLILVVHLLEAKILDFGVKLQKLLSWVSLRYEALDISKVRYLAIVFDSEEVRDASKVLELLQWIADIGIKKVCLYDTEGLLKKSKEAIIERFSAGNLSKEVTANDSLLTKKHLDLEIISFSDGKEAVAKAANYLFVKHYATSEKEKPNFTEPQMAEALAAIGSGGPDPDLLLVYGPTRSHLGFPAWRLRYTEIVHMGPLQSMKFGALVKAIHRFTMVQQNYGS